MEREGVEERNFNWRKLLIGVILIGLVYFTWSIFFSYEKCSDKACFDENLKSCNRAQFVGGDDMIFEYVIKGSDDDECEVEVKLLQGELNNEDSKKIENQKMTCALPLGAVVMPESDIGVCHGLLKEGLQDLVIRKLHTYLVQNLGRLNLEMVDIPKIN